MNEFEIVKELVSQHMNNTYAKQISKPIKVSVTRIEDIFEITNPYKPVTDKVIKDYVYSEHKRIIA